MTACAMRDRRPHSRSLARAASACWTLVASLALAGCAAASRPAPPPPVPPEAPADEGPPSPAATPAAEAVAEVAASPVRGPSDRFAPAPIPEEARLVPCHVGLAVTTYDEETRAPRTERRSVRTVVRVWDDALRERDWADVAPIPLTLAQGRALLPDVEERAMPGWSATLLAEVGDGTVVYRFDPEGRTLQVDWDPVADSRDFVFTYSYRCPPPSSSPRWVDP